MENLKKVSTEKFNISYRKFGKGPAIILIHGFPENGSLWHNIWPELLADFTVIVPDLPGTGDSSFTGDDISIEELASSINLILEQEEIHTAIIVGHSMGGYVAMAFAEEFGDKLAGLSMVHSVASADNTEKKETRRKAIELMKKGGKEIFVKQTTPNLFAEIYKKDNPAGIEAQIKRGKLLETRSMIAFYNAMINRPDRMCILENAKYPVQFVLGEEDKVIPLEDALKQAILAADNFVAVYGHCGHMSMLEKPKELSGDIMRFAKHCFENNTVTL